jgi:hypothetical protein
MKRRRSRPPVTSGLEGVDGLARRRPWLRHSDGLCAASLAVVAGIICAASEAVDTVADYRDNQ